MSIIRSMACVAGLLSSVPLGCLAEEPKPWKSFHEMHQHYTSNFERSPGFGPSRLRSVQEQELRLRLAHQSDRERPLRIRDQLYQVESQHLIGLSSDQVVIYVPSDAVDLNRSQLSTYTTREATAFELDSIKRLQSNESKTYSVNDNESMYTIVAGLRAGESCAKCHDVPRDTLLGAFVYTLRKASSFSNAEIPTSNSSNTSESTLPSQAPTPKPFTKSAIR